MCLLCMISFKQAYIFVTVICSCCAGPRRRFVSFQLPSSLGFLLPKLKVSFKGQHTGNIRRNPNTFHPCKLKKVYIKLPSTEFDVNNIVVIRYIITVFRRTAQSECADSGAVRLSFFPSIHLPERKNNSYDFILSFTQH